MSVITKLVFDRNRLSPAEYGALNTSIIQRIDDWDNDVCDLFADIRKLLLLGGLSHDLAVRLGVDHVIPMTIDSINNRENMYTTYHEQWKAKRSIIQL